MGRSDVRVLDSTESTAPPRFVSAVEVAGLHGKFAYGIDFTSEADLEADRAASGKAGRKKVAVVNEDRLTLLYGSNGTGKTTLLRLLFDGLSDAPRRNHRTAIFKSRFSRLSIRLSDGIEVRYERPRDVVTGPYSASVRRPGDSKPIVWNYFPDDHPIHLMNHGDHDNPVDLIEQADEFRRVQEEESGRFLSALSSLEMNPVFLSDARSISGDILAEDALSARRHRDAAARASAGRKSDLDEWIYQRRDLDVRDALERVRRYLSELAIDGTQVGAQRADTVYLNVVNAIADHRSDTDSVDSTILPALRTEAKRLGEKAQQYRKYGLPPEFVSTELEKRLKRARSEHGQLLHHVLTPYFDGLSQRMDALEPGLQAVASFVDALNSFLDGKKVSFQLGRRGISIRDIDTDDPLSSSNLSSGEKQIVLLFSDIVALQDQTRLFIIDEPELSLNPGWQRKLMPSLLDVTANSGMQLVAATHSIEIMAKYRSRIRRLVNQ